jgi:hypothetical protein
MGLLSKLFQGAARPRSVERVPALGPLVAASAMDPRPLWPAFSASLRGQWDLRIDANAAITELFVLKQPIKQRQAVIDRLVADDAASWTIVRATYSMKLAFDARGSGVKIYDAASFTRRVQAALEDAELAMQADLEDPAPCVIGMTLARMTDATDVYRRMYAEALGRAPACYAVHRAHNDHLAARWHGSHAAQLAHARQVAFASADGSLGAGLPINALYFQLSHLAQFDKNPAGVQAFAKRLDVLVEVRKACARSVTHPAHELGAATFDLRTKALLIAMSGGDLEHVRHLFPTIGDVYIDNTWRQLNPDPEPTFDMYRKMYGSR